MRIKPEELKMSQKFCGIYHTVMLIALQLS